MGIQGCRPATLGELSVSRGGQPTKLYLSPNVAVLASAASPRKCMKPKVRNTPPAKQFIMDISRCPGWKMAHLVRENMGMSTPCSRWKHAGWDQMGYRLQDCNPERPHERSCACPAADGSWLCVRDYVEADNRGRLVCYGCIPHVVCAVKQVVHWRHASSPVLAQSGKQQADTQRQQSEHCVVVLLPAHHRGCMCNLHALMSCEVQGRHPTSRASKKRAAAPTPLTTLVV